MNINKYIILLGIVTMMNQGCGPDSNPPEPKNQADAGEVAMAKSSEPSPSNSSVNRKSNLNISILLDLSDRIDTKKYANPSMEIYKRDLGYIESISKGFSRHLLSKPVRQDDDHIQVFFDPEPSNFEINGLAKSLKISVTKDNAKVDEIRKIPAQYASASNSIYELALEDRMFVGSDVWGFFKNKVNDYCVKPNHRNILFVLTDGYIFHKDSKIMEGNRSSYLVPELVKALNLNTSGYAKLMEEKNFGFIPVNSNLNQLEVFVLGVSPAKGNPFEGDVISAYWKKWLDEMHVKKYQIKMSDLPSNLDQIIQDYISP